MSVKLLVLGLMMEQDRHPYDIRQTIKARNWHVTFNVRDGSLYYAVDQLREEGMIEAAEVVQISGQNRPDKTIYRITDKGREALNRMLNKQLGETAFPQHPVLPALPFIRHGDRDRTLRHLESQLTACKERIALMESVQKLKEGALPRGSIHLLRGILKFSLAEKEWLDEIIAEARNGRLFEPKPL
ncbi:PadR family transcriptional regulator [Paenibacillus sp. LHD-117]|uniref:PadR family transcriptional regulator n=1 Tax=Paenibacillus sp. LHD-117 TaxID=3071412 RepID=UPI0027E01BD7|nr:PadR family transcriptional regulator [Paenibacillus sp. LHD-117]MDQ6419904.1 PadR family transcriptional regulator [Paenibacillus sp. LHD-117]